MCVSEKNKHSREKILKIETYLGHTRPQGIEHGIVIIKTFEALA
jgi:hypothetical protein